MEGWIGVTLVLCLFGGIKEIRPSYHYFTQYLEGEQVNLTHSQVNNEVYPVWTYSYLCFLPVVFISTVYVRYKPIIILQGVSLVITWCLSIWGRGLITMQIVEAILGVAASTDVAYYAYIYTKVPKEQFMHVTSYVKAAVVTGKLTSAMLAQTLLSTGLMDFFTLNFLNLGCGSVALLISFALPASKRALYQPAETDECANLITKNARVNEAEKEFVLTSDQLRAGPSSKQNGRNGSMSADGNSLSVIFIPRRNLYFCDILLFLWGNIKSCYSNAKLRRWSIWWAFGTCGNLLLTSFIQPLWEEIYPAEDNEEIYHGAAYAAKTVLGILAILALGHIKLDWNPYAELTLGLVSALQAALVFTMSQTEIIWVAYGTYSVFSCAHQMLMTITSYQVAKGLPTDLHPLIFGLNTFFALILNTILTLVVVDKCGLNLGPRRQFVVYASYFLLLGSLFLFIAIFKVVKRYVCKAPKSALQFHEQQTPDQGIMAPI